MFTWGQHCTPINHLCIIITKPKATIFEIQNSWFPTIKPKKYKPNNAKLKTADNLQTLCYKYDITYWVSRKKHPVEIGLKLHSLNAYLSKNENKINLKFQWYVIKDISNNSKWKVSLAVHMYKLTYITFQRNTLDLLC